MTQAADILREAAGDVYDELPQPIKDLYTHKEWLWLSDAGKARLVQTETEPDWIEP